MCASARKEKVGYIRHHGVHTRVSRGLCFQEHGKAPTKTGWVETDEGQPGKPNIRARWAAKDIKTLP